MNEKGIEVHWIVILVSVIVIISGVGWTYFSGEVQLAPPNCPNGFTPCGRMHSDYDCCNNEFERCHFFSQYESRCVRTEPCPLGFYPCPEGQYTTTCCTDPSNCVSGINGFYCQFQECAQGQSACRNYKNQIVCCYNPEAHTCVYEGGTWPWCEPKCKEGEKECGSGNAGGGQDTGKCCKPNEQCLAFGGVGNTPICIPKIPPKSGDVFGDLFEQN